MYMPGLSAEQPPAPGKDHDAMIAEEAHVNKNFNNKFSTCTPKLGSISPFAYGSRVKVLQTALGALDSEFYSEKQHWKTWDTTQKDLAEWSPRLSANRFTGLKAKWARFRYAISMRRISAHGIHGSHMYYAGKDTHYHRRLYNTRKKSSLRKRGSSFATWIGSRGRLWSGRRFSARGMEMMQSGIGGGARRIFVGFFVDMSGLGCALSFRCRVNASARAYRFGAAGAVR
jgi:hypothetical protein